MPSDSDRSNRLAVTFVVAGLFLAAVGIAYIIYAGRPRVLPPLTEPEEAARLLQSRALFRMLLHSFLIFLTFLLGSYVMVRIGRALLRGKKAASKTEYKDAWGNYRLTQEELDTATAQLEEDFPPDVPPPNPKPEHE
jgi:hypothetical protein